MTRFEGAANFSFPFVFNAIEPGNLLHKAVHFNLFRIIIFHGV